jgi:hypothetical protein
MYEVTVRVTAKLRVDADLEEIADELAYNLSEDGDLTAAEIVDVEIRSSRKIEPTRSYGG